MIAVGTTARYLTRYLEQHTKLNIHFQHFVYKCCPYTYMGRQHGHYMYEGIRGRSFENAFVYFSPLLGIESTGVQQPKISSVL